MVADSSPVYRDGPWRHRAVTANGARFHVVEAGTRGAPLVLLLHDFPEFWWAWRAQIPAIASAGYHVVAMDLRGAGASDKSHRSIATPILALDAAGVVSSLGYSEAILVGHGVGAQVAWAATAYAPEVTTAVVSVGSPHPLSLRAAPMTPLTYAWLASVQVPWFPERSLREGDGVAHHLSRFSASGAAAVAEQAELYTTVMRLPFAAHCAVEHLRWEVRSTTRTDGRVYTRRMRAASAVPALTIRGEHDRMFSSAHYRADERIVPGIRRVTVEGAGHFLPEEAPEQVTEEITRFLASL